MALTDGRTPIVLTTLTSHVEQLGLLLSAYCRNVITLVGTESMKEKRKKMERLAVLPSEEPLVIVATGRYVGEGFDYPRLDTLFLVSPISWKGIVAQYAGRCTVSIMERQMFAFMITLTFTSHCVTVCTSAG